jgi:hypothetical protein
LYLIDSRLPAKSAAGGLSQVPIPAWPTWERSSAQIAAIVHEIAGLRARSFRNRFFLPDHSGTGAASYLRLRRRALIALLSLSSASAL